MNYYKIYREDDIEQLYYPTMSISENLLNIEKRDKHGTTEVGYKDGDAFVAFDTYTSMTWNDTTKRYTYSYNLTSKLPSASGTYTLYARVLPTMQGYMRPSEINTITYTK